MTNCIIGADHPGNGSTCESCDARKLVIRPDRGSNAPIIHHGLIASGNQVMRHGGTRDQLKTELDILCFEMEAAGLMDRFSCLLIRRICDYSDSQKNKRWQPYAAAIAAACAMELQSLIPREQVKGMFSLTSNSEKG